MPIGTQRPHLVRRPTVSTQPSAPETMFGIASTEKDAASAALEERLWDAAEQFRANSD